MSLVEVKQPAHGIDDLLEDSFDALVGLCARFDENAALLFGEALAIGCRHRSLRFLRDSSSVNRNSYTVYARDRSYCPRYTARRSVRQQ